MLKQIFRFSIERRRKDGAKNECSACNKVGKCLSKYFDSRSKERRRKDGAKNECSACNKVGLSKYFNSRSKGNGRMARKTNAARVIKLA